MAHNPEGIVSSDTGKAYDEKIEASPDTFSDDVEIVHGINEKSLLRKLDSKLLPAVTLLYLLSFLDRSNGTRPLYCTHQ